MEGAVWGRERRGKARGWHSDAASGGKARRDCQGMADRPQSPSRIGRGAAVRSVAQADGADRFGRARCRPAEPALAVHDQLGAQRSEEHTSELQSLMRNSYAVFCLKNKTDN